MRNGIWLVTVGLAALLGGCGGGGGGVASTPTPPPAPTPPAPAPTPNTSFADLHASQTFAANDASANLSFDLSAGTTTSGTAEAATLSVSYDAASKSYTVASQGRSQTFGPADKSPSDATQSIYQKNDGTNRDRLTLVATPYTGTIATQYVQLGFWQRNVVTGTRQDTYFDTFTFGFDTPAGSVPRSGVASFNADAFGLTTAPGYEPATFQGRGRFSADFLTGTYSMVIPVTETALLSGQAIIGGNIELDSSGHLSASDGSFSGDALYSGNHGYTGGLLSGRFYGPSAQELGASVSGSGRDGSTFNGAITGQQDSAIPAINQTLTNLVAPQAFYTSGVNLSTGPGNTAGTLQVSTQPLIGQLNRQTNGDFAFGPGESDLPMGTFTSASQAASSNPNFVVYDQKLQGQDIMQDVRLSLFKPGSGNTELALTYLSFGRWSTVQPYGGRSDANEVDTVFFTYGIATPARLLTGRTGTAHYDGLVYGAAVSPTTTATYDVTGTSRFDVDFGRQSFTGGLAMRGASTSGAAAIDFGSYDVAGALGYTATSTAPITRGGVTVGELTTAFYGPGGEEMGGPLTVRVPTGAPGAGIAIGGVAIAKHQ